MKYFYSKLALLLIVSLGIFWSCSSDDESDELSREAFFEIAPQYFGEDAIIDADIDSMKIEITSNSYWEVVKEEDEENPGDWISVSPGKGTGDQIVHIQTKPNDDTEDRSIWLHFTAFTFKDSIEVTQAGRALVVSDTLFEDVAAEGAVLNLNLKSKAAWTAELSGEESWLTLNETEGEGGSVDLEIDVAENTEVTPRRDSIRFTAGNAFVWVKVAQKEMEEEVFEPVLTLSSTEATVEAAAGEISLDLTANIAWQAGSSTEGVSFTPAEGTEAEEAQQITVSYPQNTTSEARTIELVIQGKDTHEDMKQVFKITQNGMASPEIAVASTNIEIDGKSQLFTIELTSSNVDWKAVSTSSRFVITENKSGAATSAPVLIKVNATENGGLENISGSIEIQAASDPGIKTVVTINQGLHPKNNESAVYANPATPTAELGLDRGVTHPTQEGWEFWNAHEFNNTTGFWNFNTALGIKNAIFAAENLRLEDGTLKIVTTKLAEPTKNIHGEDAEYATAPLYSKRHHQGGVKWVKFVPNMRVEVRYRSSGHSGFNEAIWFMGQSNYDGQGINWPDAGEIDLMEAPFEDEAHFTLHTQNFSTVTGNPETASVKLVDETEWHIYWMEMTDDKITGGVNGYQYFEHNRGDGGNNDWPWDNPAGMMLILTPGIGGWTGEMPDMAPGEEAFMEFDWIRVYTNDQFDESTQTGHDGKFY